MCMAIARTFNKLAEPPHGIIGAAAIPASKLKAKTSAYVAAQIAAFAAVLVLISLPLESGSQQPISAPSTSQELTFTSFSCTSTSKAVTNVLPVSSESQLLSMVNSSFTEHLLHLGSRNTFAATNDFEDGAQMAWSGSGFANAGGFAGNYTGLRAINEVYEGLLEIPTSLSIVNESWTLATTGPESAVVHSSLGFEGYGNATHGEGFDAQVVGTDYYVAANGWQISQEFWNFTSFDWQYSFSTMFGPGPSDDSCYH